MKECVPVMSQLFGLAIHAGQYGTPWLGVARAAVNPARTETAARVRVKRMLMMNYGEDVRSFDMNWVCCSMSSLLRFEA
jgi:hypothetical protein